MTTILDTLLPLVPDISTWFIHTNTTHRMHVTFSVKRSTKLVAALGNLIQLVKYLERGKQVTWWVEYYN